MTEKPYADTRLPAYLAKRILELRPIKTQARIASEAGYVNPNMLSLLKSGSTRLPIDRVPDLAKALGADPRRLLLLAVEQWVGTTAMRTIETILGTIVTANEVVWIDELRDASDHSDPSLTARARSILRSIFGK